ncbi:MAG: DNA mismatch repair endonuclease MutL [Defluviitaleaceae bacterium]|nr:DNA mismatch repair endonuclease MutL [Defluviitaleaceae bacterium]
MPAITQLNQSLINKIAAGEVVERPLSVVKELTENAIDAGANIITVEISDGGLASIRVTDNGSGIPASELPLAFARHATSKISKLDDLFSVATLGFRGEALSSIAAVAQVEMITKTQAAAVGTRVEVHGGKFISTGEIACAGGTTIIVSNLFYNTPARRKFLKKPATEAGYISDCLEKLALCNPGLTIRLINNSKMIFQTNGNGDLQTAMLNVYDRETATKTIPVETESDTYRLHGLVGKPEIARGNRQHSSFFINGRYIKSNLLSRAVEAAMRTMLPSGRFPIYALHLWLPYDALDVNVHPNKMDVRFQDEEGLFHFVETAVRSALDEQNLIPQMQQKPRNRSEGSVFQQPALDEPARKAAPPPPIKRKASHALPPIKDYFPPKKPATDYLTSLANSIPTPPPNANDAALLNELFPPSADAALPFDLPAERRKPLPGQMQTDSGAATLKAQSFAAAKQAAAPQPAQKKPTMREAQTTPAPRFFQNYYLVGLVFNTYWLVTQGDSLYLIDQHAAHERVLYEDLLEKARSQGVHSQNLLAPISLRLTPRERQLLEENKAMFADFGFEVGGQADAPEILSVPYMMQGAVNPSFFTDLLDKISEAGFDKGSPYAHKTELIAKAACKAAIKGGDFTSQDEAKALIKQLLELDNPFTCPHGRPTIIELTKRELERRFKRS